MTRSLTVSLGIVAVLILGGRGVAADPTLDFQALDDADGNPLPGVTIRVYVDYEYRLLTTDADGRAGFLARISFIRTRSTTGRRGSSRRGGTGPTPAARGSRFRRSTWPG